MKKFRLEKSEVVDDLDLSAVSELIKVRDRLNKTVDDLNREIAKKGLEEALVKADFSSMILPANPPGKHKLPPQRNNGKNPNGLFLLDEAGQYDAKMYKEAKKL